MVLQSYFLTKTISLRRYFIRMFSPEQLNQLARRKLEKRLVANKQETSKLQVELFCYFAISN